MNNRQHTQLQNGGIDTVTGLQQYQEDAAKYEKALLDFVKDETYERMRRALHKQDWRDMEIAARILIQVAEPLGMQRLTSACVKTVKQLRDSNHMSAFACFAAIQVAYIDVSVAIRGVLGGCSGVELRADEQMAQPAVVRQP